MNFLNKIGGVQKGHKTIEGISEIVAMVKEGGKIDIKKVQSKSLVELVKKYSSLDE